MSRTNDVIYCLAEIGGQPFYVGRSGDWHARYYEHRRAARTGTEAKYQHIRKLWRSGRDFEIIVLDENPGKHYERYYHYVLGCVYDLTNQKLGDANRAREQSMARMRREGLKFETPEQFLSELERDMREYRARQKAARTQAKIRSNSSDVERTLFVGEKPHERFVSPAYLAIKEKLKNDRNSRKFSK